MLVFYPLRRERTLLALLGGSVALSVGLSAWLIPQYGVMGAAWSTLAVRALLTLVCGVALWFALRDGMKPQMNADDRAQDTR